ncbi:Uncharacterised protein [Bifidobacterium dentium]|nr:hypothetical protein SAMN05192536_1558 [Bifidobacterium dentium JCM 1195 = DSM 20436]VEG24559.1 Uncharacterised protein [Bifidobacterium dentium]
MTIHELVHACLLSWRNPDMRVSISTDWLRDGLQESPAADAPGFLHAPCLDRARAMCLTGLYGPSFVRTVMIGGVAFPSEQAEQQDGHRHDVQDE